MPSLSISPIAGAANLLDTTPNTLGGVSIFPAFPLGMAVKLNDGGEAVYIQALSEISTYAAVGISVTGRAQMLTTTTAAATKRFAVAQTSIPSGYYGWVQSGGSFVVNVAASCAASVPLFTTATAGVLDDATVSAGAIAGTIITYANVSNATAASAFGSNPFILTVWV